MHRLSIRLLAVAALATAAAAQTAPQSSLKARELFYAALVKQNPPGRGGSKGPPPKSEPKTEPAVETVSPPGIRYSILKVSAGSPPQEVPASTVFRTGDRIQLQVTTNRAGYLYVINQGSSGTWQLLFPVGKSYQVEPYRQYVVPPTQRILFDELKGVERLFIVSTLNPEPNLERAIQIATAGRVEVADAQIGNLRSAYARDLIIEEITPATSTGSATVETAMYVVAKSGPNVVAEMGLAHQ